MEALMLALFMFALLVVGPIVSSIVLFIRTRTLRADVEALRDRVRLLEGGSRSAQGAKAAAGASSADSVEAESRPAAPPPLAPSVPQRTPRTSRTPPTPRTSSGSRAPRASHASRSSDISHARARIAREPHRRAMAPQHRHRGNRHRRRVFRETGDRQQLDRRDRARHPGGCIRRHARLRRRTLRSRRLPASMGR